MSIRLVVGLGNPGRRYAGTRHNVGFMLLDGLAPSGPWLPWKPAELGEYAKPAFSDEVFLVRPLTFMNLSGRMVQSFAHFYKIQPEQILVCYDDSDLPLGRIRLRLKGSAGGHNGMASVIETLGTQEVPRLRIGIRAESNQAPAGDMVLSSFTAEERKALIRPFEDAKAAVELACRESVEAAMNKYNAGPAAA